MTVNQLLDKLDLKLMAGESGLENEINGAFTGDLLSIVLANAKEKDIWMTVQGHENSVAVAIMAGISAIILTQGIEPTEKMCEKANEHGIPVLKTKMTSYEMCIEISHLL